MQAHTAYAAHAAAAPARRTEHSAMPALYGAAVGPINAARYLQFFERQDDTGRTLTSWNWAAAMCTLSWMVFRQLWGAALVYVAALEGVALLVFAIGHQVLGLPMSVLAGLGLAWLAAACVLPGLYGDAIVHAEVRKKIDKALSAAATVPQAEERLLAQAASRRRLIWIAAANGVLALLAAALWLAFPDGGRSALARLQAPVAAAPAALTASAPSPAASRLAQSPAPASATAAAPTGDAAAASNTPAAVAMAQASESVSKESVAPAPARASTTAPAAATSATAPASAVSAAATRPSAPAAAMARAASSAVTPPAATASQAPSPAASRATPLAVAATQPARPASASPMASAAAPATRSAATSQPATTQPPAKLETRPATVAPLPASAPGERKLYINVGLFGEPDNARRAHARLREADLPAQQGTVTMGSGRKLTRVRVGPFTSTAEANAAATKIREMGLDTAATQQ
ncbi:MAG: DUF2628 domain-containing protein [Comamonadaceae bacterium]|nr:MAG: DUF2628 domain-containing protein [Comamonadaceae bacterium]